MTSMALEGHTMARAGRGDGRDVRRTSTRGGPRGSGDPSGGPGDPRTGALGRVEDPLLEPRVLAVEDLPGDRLVARVGVHPQLAEEAGDGEPGLAAVRVGEAGGARRAPVGVLHLRPEAHGGHREELGADVDDPAEEALPVLEAALPPRHAVEGRAGEPARGALDEPHVPREGPEAGV